MDRVDCEIFRCVDWRIKYCEGPAARLGRRGEFRPRPCSKHFHLVFKESFLSWNGNILLQKLPNFFYAQKNIYVELVSIFRTEKSKYFIWALDNI